MKNLLIGLLFVILGCQLQAQEKYNASLAKELEAILDSDQKARNEVIALQNSLGQGSEEVKAKWKEVHKVDSVNLIAVNRILDEHGWLGPDVLGKKGSIALFLVIQHADLDTQVERLPQLRDAVEKGDASASNLALLEDRVAMFQGKKQIYGSQLRTDPNTGEFYLFPMIDPEHVNERRAKVGLGTIESYIAFWDLKWDVEAHKKRVAAWEAEGKDK